jgi:Mor family transcriptional regulator
MYADFNTMTPEVKKLLLSITKNKRKNQMKNIQGQQIFLTKEDVIRVSQIQKELSAIEEGYTDMLDGNETVTDRALKLAYELLNIINGGVR